jgi:hypothetical protein
MNLSEINSVEYDNITSNMNYDPDTGVFTWSKPYRGNIVGSIVGRELHSGYWQIRFMSKNYLAHRLAWFYCFKEWPAEELDHINRVRSDNRLDNLREATRKENSRNCNNTSTYGHNIYKRYDKFRVARQINGTILYFGTYKNLETAIAVRDYIEYCQSNLLPLPSAEELHLKYESQ